MSVFSEPLPRGVLTSIDTTSGAEVPSWFGFTVKHQAGPLMPSSLGHDGGMQLPLEVREAIERRADEVSFASLKREAEEMSNAYRAGAQPPRIATAARVAAYLVTRMPATYAAARAVLRETHRLLGDRKMSSVLDVGAGSGAAALAALEEYPEATLTLADRGRALLEAAKQWLPQARLLAEDVTRLLTIEAHDLVILAYSAGEIGVSSLARLWQAARVAFVLIEPGTPRGFAFVRAVRSKLLAEGAHMIAPCPFAGICPMVDPNWCHFGARVERSSLHRRIKGGMLGYEDEKYSYVALAREPVELVAARIIGRPRQIARRSPNQPKWIELETCTPDGLKTGRVTKRDRDRYRAARHADWGSPWDMMNGDDRPRTGLEHPL
jgi:ribosomal protein RSM22 (predicted rRNA methylase)